MAVDSAKRRKSVVAIGLMAVGPVVVADSSIDLFDRKVVGYGYGRGAAAGFIKIRNATLSTASASATLSTASATATLKA